MTTRVNHGKRQILRQARYSTNEPKAEERSHNPTGNPEEGISERRE